MMNFRTAKKNLVTILGSNANGRFRVVGFQQQGSGASEFVGNDRRVQVIYSDGDFPKGSAGIVASTQHMITLGIELTVSAESLGDMAVLDNPLSTPAEKAAALDGTLDSSDLADDSLDELFDIVYQILMDGTNYDLGTTGPPYIFSSRWVGALNKNQPMNFGEYVVITGTVQFTCQAVETITGDTGTPAVYPAFDVTDDIDGDDNEKTGSIT